MSVSTRMTRTGNYHWIRPEEGRKADRGSFSIVVGSKTWSYVNSGGKWGTGNSMFSWLYVMRGVLNFWSMNNGDHRWVIPSPASNLCQTSCVCAFFWRDLRSFHDGHRRCVPFVGDHGDHWRQSLHLSLLLDAAGLSRALTGTSGLSSRDLPPSRLAPWRDAPWAPIPCTLSCRLPGAVSVHKLCPVAIPSRSSILRPSCHCIQTLPLYSPSTPGRIASATAFLLLRLRDRPLGGGRTLALAVFWEQLYDTLTVLLRQAGVALWLSTFPVVWVGSYIICGDGCCDSWAMRQKRKGAKGRERQRGKGSSREGANIWKVRCWTQFFPRNPLPGPVAPPPGVSLSVGSLPSRFTYCGF